MLQPRWFRGAVLVLLILALAGVVSAEGPQPQSVDQLTLPYDGTVSTTGTAFAVMNNGVGPSAVGVAGRTDQGFAGVVGYSQTRYGVYGLSTATNESGVLGDNDTGIGVRGRTVGGTGVRGESVSGRGVWGSASGSLPGVLGQHSGPTPGQGVVALTDVGQGLYAESYNGVGAVIIGAGTDGLQAVSRTDGAAGVLGSNDGAGLNGVGVRGRATTGLGVQGISGSNAGVSGVSTSGNGVFARSQQNVSLRAEGGNNEDTAEFISTADGRSGLYAHHDGSARGTGVYGASEKGHGVEAKGRSDSSLLATGRSGDAIEAVTGANGKSAVYGRFDGNEDDGNAAYFDGRVEVSGTLAKSSGSFKIDHPLDPANKYLYHSFVESPDMMNVYNGNVTTDAAGTATVKLPDYFQALNRDFRYQLTVIGQFAQAIVADEIQNNQFVIKTDKPNVKVSWQVTGIRQDAYAKAHPIVPEVEKPAAEKGSYIHPDLFGEPASKSLGFVNRPQSLERMLKGETREP